ncbi:hypothetical protein BDV28DRAFT_45929 [Aspergillus coremiiformis]|uniref:Zn(2)-C6 fungal-type domain-containing protein n=1 Tax=Aspergillus coremiiformis TaxID=138285 RepID=A0A5N6YXK1_9EURO|nr:hypothetical protein BDV28DRAFT_45929 [Aspergillus coremiiformis]
MVAIYSAVYFQLHPLYTTVLQSLLNSSTLSLSLGNHLESEIKGGPPPSGVAKMTVMSLVQPKKRANASRRRSLWLPIIAPKGTTSTPSINPLVSVKSSIPRPHARFPPRSRTGCWTCRSRKVKCDERHPRCNQCTRLGHDCDYRPRLSFRDDTHRIIQRMSAVETVGNVVWDREISFIFLLIQYQPRMCSPTYFFSIARMFGDLKPPAANFGIPDQLPSFAALTSDEERERKAQSSIPGTYTVIVIPESFSHLPKLVAERIEESYRNSSSLLDGGQSRQTDKHPELNDPNVVILKTFPDARRYLCSGRRDSTPTLESESRDSSLCTISISSAVPNTLDDGNAQEETKLTGYEATLLDHFRNAVWPRLVPRGIWLGSTNGHELSIEVFEQEAAIFPPLLQAIMAISALSLIRQGNKLDMSAMSHYRQGFPLPQYDIRHSKNHLSDGLFFTQFFLLIYEIMAAKSNEPNSWSHHISRLLEITSLRQSAFGIERYPCIIWWTCNIDLYALFSGAGTGYYVKTVIENDLLPGPESVLPSVGSDDPGVLDSHEHNSLTFMLRLYKDMFILAVRLGLTIAEAKKQDATYPYLPVSLQQQGAELYGEFKGLWGSADVHFWTENQTKLPQQLQDILEQVYLLFHTSLLLYFTSMWPGQGIGFEESPEEKAHQHTTAVLQHVEARILKIQESPRHFLIFPLFLAGVAAGSSDLKVKAWELLSSLEESEIGYNASTTCSMLQQVYERQMQQSRNGGGPFLWVDWVELLVERGFQLVSFG